MTSISHILTLALVNHWKNEKVRLEDDAKRVTLMFGDIPSKYRVYPFGDNKDSDNTIQGPKEDQQPQEPISFGEAPVTKVTRTIWKTVTRYMTKLPIITFEGPNDWTFETGKPYDFEEYHNADMIKIRLPSHWSKDNEDYSPPVYDSEPEEEHIPRIQPRCHYHWVLHLAGLPRC